METNIGGGEETDRGNEDEALMLGRIGTSAIGEKDEDGKIQHVAHRNDVESLGIEAWRRSITAKHVGCGQDAEDRHESGKTKSDKPEAAVNVHAVGGNEGSLNDKKQDPAGKGSAVKMNDGVGKRRPEDAGEKVGGGKADKDGNEDESRHHGEEEMIVTAAGQCTRDDGLLSDGRSHGASKMERDSGRGLVNAENFTAIGLVEGSGEGRVAVMLEHMGDLAWSDAGEGKRGKLIFGEELGIGGFVAVLRRAAAEFGEEEELIGMEGVRGMALEVAIEKGGELRDADLVARFLLSFAGRGDGGRLADVGPAAGESPGAVLKFADEKDATVTKDGDADIDFGSGVASLAGEEVLEGSGAR